MRDEHSNEKKKAIEIAHSCKMYYSIPFPINYAFAILLPLQILFVIIG
jgi:hypothetical protein